LQEVIHTAPAELGCYDEEISRLQNQISALIKERTSLASHLEACQCVLSPVRRLPVELLAKIFELC
ncbi:hypothetical protein B0H13DRAFT_1521497, partial [Mycena leptocephala]